MNWNFTIYLALLAIIVLLAVRPGLPQVTRIRDVVKSPGFKACLNTVIWTVIGAFSPILITICILLFSVGFSVDFSEFVATGDFFIIAAGLVIPSFVLVVRQRQYSTVAVSYILLVGFILVAIPSLAYAAIRLSKVFPHPGFTLPQTLLGWASFFTVVGSICYAFFLQYSDEERILIEKKQTVLNEPSQSVDALETKMKALDAQREGNV